MEDTKILVHTVGDSHAWHCWLKIPYVQTHQLGPMTMYHFGQARPIVVNDMPKDLPVVFCWGEIDCRCHVIKHPPYGECIDKLVEDYLIGVDQNAKLHPNIWLFNVVPPPRRAWIPEVHNFPFLGTDEDVLEFVKRMNMRLKNNGRYPFVDVYSEYADADGYLRKDRTVDFIHIFDEKPLIEWIQREFGREEEASLSAIPDD